MADYLKYDNENFIVASGNVKLLHSDITLNADLVILDTFKSKFVAEGHVSLNFQGKNIRAERLEYSINDKDLVFNEFIATFNVDESASPIYFKCKSIEKKYGVYFGGESSFSTCKPDRQHYVITAKKFVLYPGERIEAYDVYAYAGILPFLYTPYYEFQLGYRNPIYLMPIIGQNNVEGTFVKNTFDYYYNRDFHAMFLFDVMEKKNYGIGIKGEYFRKKNHPGELYIYSIDSENYAFSATQRFIFNSQQNISIYLKKRNLYRIYGGRDDFIEYKVSATDPEIGNLTVFLKTDYSYKWNQQQYIWNKNFDGTKYDLNITLDDYRQSATKYDKIMLNTTHPLYQNSFTYFNTNYYTQNKRYERLYNNFHSNLGEDFSLDVGLTYQNNNNNGQEDLQLNPRIGVLYNAYKNEWFKKQGIKLIRLETNMFIDPDGNKVTSDETLEFKETLPELTIDFYTFNASNIYYTPQVIIGSYRERKNIGIMRDITYKRLLLRNAFSNKLIEGKLIDLALFMNYDQFLYETGDKQYMLSDRAELTLFKEEAVSNKLSYSESNVQGYTPFYFDETRSSQKRVVNVLTYQIAQYLTLKIEDGFDLLSNYREQERFNLSYMVHQNQYIILSTAYDHNTKSWGNLNSQIVFLKDKENYVTMKTNINLKTGEIADSRLQLGYSMGREERWIFKTELLWNNYNKVYTIPTIEVIRDLGCVSLKYSYNDYLKEHMFIFKITAFPEDAMGYSYGVEGFKLEGVGESSVER